MKRLICLLICLGCLLGGCKVDVPPPSAPQSPSSGPVSATPPSGVDDWAPFSLGEIGSRRSPEPCYELKAADDYGYLYPFAVPLSAMEHYEWGDQPPRETQSRNLFGLVDDQGRVVVDPIYRQIRMLEYYDAKTNDNRAIGVYFLSLANAERDWGDNDGILAACDGSWVCEGYAQASAGPEAILVERIERPSEDEWRWKYGLTTHEGKTLLPCEYENLSLPSEGLIAVSPGSGSGCHYLNLQGETVITLDEYIGESTGEIYIGSFSDGLAYVLINGLYGYIGPDGEFAIPPQFSGAQDFQDGYAIVNENSAESLQGVVDKNGAVVIPFQYRYIYSHKGVFFCNLEQDEVYFILRDGVAVELERRDFPYAYYESDGESLVVFGLGHETRLDQSAWARPLPNGTLIVDGAQSGVVKTDGTWVRPPEDGAVNMSGNVSGLWVNDVQDYLYISEGGEQGKTRVYDLNLQPVLPERYDQVCAVGGLFTVIQGRYSGIVDRKGRWLFRKSLLDYLPD